MARTDISGALEGTCFEGVELWATDIEDAVGQLLVLALPHQISDVGVIETRLASLWPPEMVVKKTERGTEVYKRGWRGVDLIYTEQSSGKQVNTSRHARRGLTIGGEWQVGRQGGEWVMVKRRPNTIGVRVSEEQEAAIKALAFEYGESPGALLIRAAAALGKKHKIKVPLSKQHGGIRQAD